MTSSSSSASFHDWLNIDSDSLSSYNEAEGAAELPDITSVEEFHVFSAQVANLHPDRVALAKCGKAASPDDCASRRGMFMYALAFLVGFRYPIEHVIMEILAFFIVIPFRLASNGWPLLASIPILNHILNLYL